MFVSSPSEKLSSPAELPMDKPAVRTISPLFPAVFAALGLVAISCCLAAEFTKGHEEDMNVDGMLCNLPRTRAFALGLVAIVSLSLAQILGTSLAMRTLLRRSKEAQKPPVLPLAISWASFAMASVLLGTGTSMNKGQPYGKGWLDGRCYLVRRGVYASAAVLAVLNSALLIASVLPAGWPKRRRMAPSEMQPPPL